MPQCSDAGDSPPPGCDPDVFRLVQAGATRPRFQQALLRFRSRQKATRWAAHRSSSAARQRDGDGVLNQYEVPTAQISVFVFNDNNPINGAPDLPQETGLAGFHVRLIEAGGTYGASGGEVTQDAFGNPLGTNVRTPMALSSRYAAAAIILTDANGVALIQNLYPAKYTILVDPPEG